MATELLFPAAVAIAATLAVMSVFFGFFQLAKPGGDLDDRLEQALKREQTARGSARPGAALSRLLGSTPAEKTANSKAALELAQADLSMSPREFAMVRVGAIGVGFLVGLLLLRNVVFGVALGLLGAQMPVFYLHRRCGQRHQKFQSQLVDVVGLLVSGLRAGIGLVQAMELVRREMPSPAKDEFARVVREIGLGASLQEALNNLLARMPSDDLGMIVTVINIQSEVGGNLAQVLDGVIHTIRERVRIAQEVRALTAQQRMTGYILSGMPFVVGGAIYALNPEFMAPLFSLKWIWLPGMALIMIAIGFVVIGKIVDIKV